MSAGRRIVSGLCRRLLAERSRCFGRRQQGTGRGFAFSASCSSFHGDFLQALCLTSKVKDGAIVVDRDGKVKATGQIVSHGKSDPTDVKAAYVHFHEFGEPSKKNGVSYLLLMTKRAGNQFVCPIHNGQTRISVLAADNSNSIAFKELDVDDRSSESASECLWFTETTKAGFWRLYVLEPATSRKLYMAADSAGVMFITEDETLSISREGMENPATNFRLFLKQHIADKNAGKPVAIPP